MTRFAVLLILLSGCGEQSPPAKPIVDTAKEHPTAVEPRSADRVRTQPLVKHELTEFTISLPKPIRSTERSTRTGSISLVAGEDLALVASFCLAPVTAFPQVRTALEKGSADALVSTIRSMFPALEGADLRLKPEAHAVWIERCKARNEMEAEGRVWFLPEVHHLAFLLLLTRTSESLRQDVVAVADSLRVHAVPKNSPDRLATDLRAAIPEDWLLSENEKHYYWARPDARAFFMLSKGTENPYAEPMPGYGMEEDQARLAIEMAEKMARRKFEITSSTLIFDPLRFCVVSRAVGWVEYRSGRCQVEMDYWYDPRLRKNMRIYIGGRTEEDLADTRRLRGSLEYDWKD